MRKFIKTCGGIAFVVETLPCATENFIYRDFLGVAKLRPDVKLLAIRQGPDAAWSLLEQGAALRAMPWAIVERRARHQGFIHARWMLRHPLKYWLTAMRSIQINRGPRPGAFKRFHHAVLLADLASSHQIGRLHACFANHLANVVHLAAKLCGVSYSISAHAYDVWVQTPSPVVIRRATRCVACTAVARDQIRRLHPAANVALVRHGIAMPQLSGLRRGVGPDPLHIISAGRFVAKKGFDTLICACEILKRQGLRFSCEIFGDGPLRGMLEAQIAEADLKGPVRLRSFLAHQELMRHLAAAHLCVLPCRIDPGNGDRDGMPNILLEAISCGAVIIAGDLPALRELIVPGETGLLTPPEDPNALAEVILKVTETPEWMQSMRVRAIRMLERQYDVDRNASALLEAITSENDGRLLGECDLSCKMILK